VGGATFLYLRVSFPGASIESPPVTEESAKRLAATLIAAVLAMALLAACGSSSASGPDQFRGKTKSPLLDFGEEGNDAELEEATEAVHSFFVARSQGDWKAVCAQLSQAMLAKIEHLATSATDLADTSCPSFLETFTSLSDKERRDSTVVDEEGSLRLQGDHGFLVYYGADEVVYAMPLSREDGAWKLGSLSSKQLSQG
jgi:hypothetical protein